MKVPPIRALFYLSIALLAASNVRAQDAPAKSESALQSIRADLVMGRADHAISQLTQYLSASSRDATAHNLFCRVLYQEERWDEAIHECELAVSLYSQGSDLHLWLGRTYGEKADSIHSIKAYGLAKKVRDEFEQAARLDNKSVDALSDLGEFYVTAPAIVGGDKKKAQAVSQSLAQLDAERANQLYARLAEKDKNYTLAETELKAAIAASREPAGAWMTLASFYARRKQADKTLQALHAGVDADARAAKPHGAALVDAAGLLIREHQELPTAIELLKSYLASPNKSEDTPAFQVHARLSQLLAARGDQAGARQQMEASSSLASAYRPAPLK